MTSNKWLGRAMPYLTVLAMLLVWELTCVLFAISSFVLPRPTVVAVSLYQNFNTIWFHAERTLLTTLLGFGLAVGVGSILGIVVGSSHLVYQGLYPVLVGFNSDPQGRVGATNGGLVRHRFGAGSVDSFYAQLLSDRREHRDRHRDPGAGVARRAALVGRIPARLISRVGLPRSLPYFFASLKIAITLAFVGSVISETLASDRGIGTLVEQASANFKIPLVFAGLVVVATLGIAMYAFFAYIEKRMTHWATRTVESELAAESARRSLRLLKIAIIGQRPRPGFRLKFGEVTFERQRIAAQFIELFGHGRHHRSHLVKQLVFVDPGCGAIGDNMAAVDPDVTD